MYERTTKHFFRFHFFTSCDVCTPSHLTVLIAVVFVLLIKKKMFAFSVRLVQTKKKKMKFRFFQISFPTLKIIAHFTKRIDFNDDNDDGRANEYSKCDHAPFVFGNCLCRSVYDVLSADHMISFE